MYNDAALSIAALLPEGVRKVAYIDVDAHHGDGVQTAFDGDPRVLTVSNDWTARRPGGGHDQYTDHQHRAVRGGIQHPRRPADGLGSRSPANLAQAGQRLAGMLIFCDPDAPAAADIVAFYRTETVDHYRGTAGDIFTQSTPAPPTAPSPPTP